MNDRDLLKTFVDVMFHKYGSYAHAAGYLESTVVGLLQGNESFDDVRRRIAQVIEKETAQETV